MHKSILFSFLLAFSQAQAATKTSAPVDKTAIYKVVSGTMVLDRSNILEIVDSDKKNFNGRITIEKEDTFSVLATRTKPNGIVMVELGIDSDFSYEPNVFWVNAEALNSIKTELYDPNAPDLSLNIYGDNNIYRDDDGTPLSVLLSDDPDLLGELVATEVAGKGKVKRHHRGKKMTHCLRDVRKALAKAKICNSASFGLVAGQALDDIEQQCKFTRVSYSENMPKGAVCISQGGNKNCGTKKRFAACGHAAMSDGNGNWIGAGVRKSPMLSGHYDLACAAPSGFGYL